MEIDGQHSIGEKRVKGKGDREKDRERVKKGSDLKKQKWLNIERRKKT